MPPEDESKDLNDVWVEDTTRGRKQPKKALSLARMRLIRRVAEMLANPKCDEGTYIDAIHAFELPEGSPEFRQLLALWRKRRGSGK